MLKILPLQNGLRHSRDKITICHLSLTIWNASMKSFFNQPQEVNLQGPVCHIKTEGKTTRDLWRNVIYFR